MDTTQTVSSQRVTSYTKLRDGNWGLRGYGLTPGAAVQVKKRDGSTKSETVGRILWTGSDGVQLAMIAGAASYRHAQTGQCVRTGKDDRTCLTCGHVERRNNRGYVDGDWVRGGECQSCREERKMGY